ncbi:MAG: dihydrolipoamide dehydrogenase [Gammaproteobacteria bacterium]|jgi:dihydrolipoamide dehydrogenase
MSVMPIDVKVPNIGDFNGVEIIDIPVKEGEIIKPEETVITLESDKATMDIPSDMGGLIKKIHVNIGDKVAEGDVILTLEGEQKAETKNTSKKIEVEAAEKDESKAEPVTISTIEQGKGDVQADLVVLGSGPGGYTAAFHAADLGLKTILVERYSSLGGVCLNVGCIPSKALLHAAKVISETKEAHEFGIEFDNLKIDTTKMSKWKDKIIGQLTNGLKGLAKERKVEIVHGSGKFISSNQLSVETAEGKKVIGFKNAIIAAGSEPVNLPFLPDDTRVINSTGALKLESTPKRMLVLGGGIIGLEMATVYHELGTKITVVEMLDKLIAGADPDIVRPLQKRITRQYENIYLSTKVTAVKAEKNGLVVSFEGDKAPETDIFDSLLVAVGRTPNGNKIGAELAGVTVDERGFINVDDQQRTNVPNIFAIGDITGQPMLAHKATHEGKVAAAVCAGEKRSFIARVIPSVAYTDPEVAWVGITEAEAKQQNIDYGKGVFPWAASGRSLSLGRNEGLTKLIFDNHTQQVIGAGIVGSNAGDLIAEVALAIEMNCEAEDISLTVHPHPTLSETIAFASEMFDGTITDLYIPKKK